MNIPVSFELAKLLKEKGFDKHTLHFYTTPNSKMFGIDEHGRYYPIKNKSKSLWITGQVAAFRIQNIYQAPTIAEVVMWLLEKYHIWIFIQPQTLIGLYKDRKADNWYYTIIHCDRINSNYYRSPTEAYEAAIEYTLNNLI